MRVDQLADLHDRRLEQRRHRDRARRYEAKNPLLSHDLLTALADPGRYVKRGDKWREPLYKWQHRAVLAVLSASARSSGRP